MILAGDFYVADSLLKPFGMQISNFENTIYLAAANLDEKVSWMCRLGTLISALAQAQPTETRSAELPMIAPPSAAPEEGAARERAMTDAPAAARAAESVGPVVQLPSPEEVRRDPPKATAAGASVTPAWASARPEGWPLVPGLCSRFRSPHKPLDIRVSAPPAACDRRWRSSSAGRRR